MLILSVTLSQTFKEFIVYLLHRFDCEAITPDFGHCLKRAFHKGFCNRMQS